MYIFVIFVLFFVFLLGIWLLLLSLMYVVFCVRILAVCLRILFVFVFCFDMLLLLYFFVFLMLFFSVLRCRCKCERFAVDYCNFTSFIYWFRMRDGELFAMCNRSRFPRFRVHILPSCLIGVFAEFKEGVSKVSLSKWTVGVSVGVCINNQKDRGVG